MYSIGVILSIFCAIVHLCEGKVSPLDGKIVNGTAVNIINYPYQLSLQSDGYHICGASILNSIWVLTAAHCVDGRVPRILSLRAGSSTKEKNGQVRLIVGYAKHPSYNKDTYDYDYAVIKVHNPFVYTAGVAAIKMASSLPAVGTKVYLSGWGALESGGSSPTQLQGVEVKFTDWNTCNTQYDDELTSRMFCAAAEGKDTCQGDSGGPAVVKTSTGARILTGVVSWGRGCARPDFPGIYSSIPVVRSWIRGYTGF